MNINSENKLQKYQEILKLKESIPISKLCKDIPKPFENRIRQNEINNPKFNFLNPADPYHAYYQHKVKEFKEGRGL